MQFSEKEIKVLYKLRNKDKHNKEQSSAGEVSQRAAASWEAADGTNVKVSSFVVNATLMRSVDWVRPLQRQRLGRVASTG